MWKDQGFWYYVETKSGREGIEYYILDKDFNKVVQASDEFLRNYSPIETIITDLYPNLKEYIEYEHIENTYMYCSPSGKFYFNTQKVKDGKDLNGLIDLSLNIIIDCEYEKITYYPAVSPGVHNYNIWAFTGSWDSFSIIDEGAPEHFTAKSVGSNLLFVFCGRFI